jgi:acetyltransferase-like isoleucine patch superfamily enzyme
MEIVNKLKKNYWLFHEEIILWKMKIIMEIPGNLGIGIRKKILPHILKTCGENISISEGCWLQAFENLSLGNNVRISRGVFINAGGGVKIGNDVLIGPSVKIWSVNHNFSELDIPIHEQGYNYSTVTIGNNVWIAANVIILPGITVSDKTVIAAGSVVTKDLKPCALYGGNPARLIRERKAQHNL